MESVRLTSIKAQCKLLRTLLLSCHRMSQERLISCSRLRKAGLPSARSYSAIVEKQIKGFNAAPSLPKFSVNATREAKIQAIIQKLNREIRYTGIEFGDASVIPRSPAEVLQRKYGD